MRRFHHELAQHAVQSLPGAVLWCDGEHGFNPYELAELNLERGFEADAGAQRVLIKRCMTPFQWDTVLTRHLDQKLLEADASMVLAAPYDALFSTDELKDWEQEDYVAYSLRHLRALARRHRVPVLLSVDMARWWRTHPVLARLTFEAVDARWSVARLPHGWRVAPDVGKDVIEAADGRQVTLQDFVSEADRELHAAPLPRPARKPPRSP